MKIKVNNPSIYYHLSDLIKLRPHTCAFISNLGYLYLILEESIVCVNTGHVFTTDQVFTVQYFCDIEITVTQKGS